MNPTRIPFLSNFCHVLYIRESAMQMSRNRRVSFRFRIAGARFCPLALLLSILTVLIDPRTLAPRQSHPPLAIPHRIASHRIAALASRTWEIGGRSWFSVGCWTKKKATSNTVRWFRFIANYPRAYCLLLPIQITTRIHRRIRILRPRI